MKKLKRELPLQEYDKTAEFAGMQYMNSERCNKKHSERKVLFKNSIERLIMSNFKWYGINADERNAIETQLNYNGRVGAIKSTLDIETQTPEGIFFGPVGADVDNIQYNFYGVPDRISISGLNGKIITAKNRDNYVMGFDTMSVIQRNVTTRPIMYWVNNLAKELDDAFEAWKVATETHKSGLVFNCDNERSASLLRGILSNISENNPYIVVTNGTPLTSDKPFTFGPGNMSAVSEYHLNFMNVWGCVLDLLGLENNSQNKRERLVTSEALMNRSLARYIAADRLQARKIFAEECNKKFGTDIQVENYLASVVTEELNEANIYGKDDKTNELE